MSEPSLRLAVALNGYGLEEHAIDGFRREVLPWEDLRALARLAERTGYETLYMPQQWGWEPTTALAALAGEVGSIGLASGVVPFRARDPQELVMTAASLQAVSAGRFVLGVGSSLPIEVTRSYVRGVADALGGGPGFIPEYEGVLGPIDLRTPRVPVYLAALGPRMASLAGEIADGVILNWCDPERVARARAAIDRREGFTIAVYVRACLSHVDRHATDALKTTMSRYLALPPYRHQLEALGLGRDAAEAARALEAGWDPSSALPDGLIEATCVWGTREAALRRLEEYRDAGADVVVVYPVAAGEPVSSLRGTVMAAAPDPSLEA